MTKSYRNYEVRFKVMSSWCYLVGWSTLITHPMETIGKHSNEQLWCRISKKSIFNLRKFPIFEDACFRRTSYAWTFRPASRFSDLASGIPEYTHHEYLRRLLIYQQTLIGSYLRPSKIRAWVQAIWCRKYPSQHAPADRRDRTDPMHVHSVRYDLLVS